MLKCPNCSSPKLQRKTPASYQYRESGLDNVYLRGNMVHVVNCRSCGERYVSIKMEQQLLQVIALDLLIRHGFLQGKEIKFLREACGLTQDELRKDLGLDRRETVTRWERDGGPRHDWGTELLLRAVLLRRFKAAINEPNNYHLRPSSVGTLLEFERVFAQYFQNFFAAPKRRERLSVENTGGHWQGQPLQMQ